MRPIAVSPSRPVDGGQVVYAADQPQYQPLPVWRRESGAVITRWRMTRRERLAILRGRDLYVELLTFDRPLQPMYPTLGEADVFGWNVTTGPLWNRTGHDESGHARDATWEPIRRLRQAIWLSRTHSRNRVQHAVHMLRTGEF